MLRQSITILFSIFLSISSAQIPKKASKAYASGQAELSKNNADKAIIYFNKAIFIYPSYKEAHLALYSLYLEKNEGANALRSLENASRYASKDKPNLLFNAAKLSIQTGEYEKALTYSMEYLGLNSKDETTRKQASLYKLKAEYAISNQSAKVSFSPTPLSAEINTKLPEYLPSVDAAQESIVFTRRINGNEDLFISKKKYNDSMWITALPWPLNTSQNEGAHTISANGKTIVFTRCNLPEGFGSCDLYISEYRKGGWSRPQNMGNAINSNAWESQPSLSADGRELYFASNRAGGYGGTDIWKSNLNQNTWSKPINLGNTINTEWEESSPCIHADRKSLYFRSTGWPGYGSADLFLSRSDQSTKWGKPINLGFPINDHREQGAMIVTLDGYTAYYSDQTISLQNQLLESNIIRFRLPSDKSAQSCIFIKGKVMDAKTTDPITPATVYFESNDGFIRTDSVLSDADGEFLLVLPTDRSYRIYATAIGYNFYSDRLLANGNSNISYNVLLSKAVVSDSNLFANPIILKNVLFKSGSFILEEESFSELQSVAGFLTDHSDLYAEIIGHTDNTGNPNENKQLSIERAKTVCQYIIQSGIEAHRINFTGYGDLQPIASNDKEEGRAQNRRVEIILKNKK